LNDFEVLQLINAGDEQGLRALEEKYFGRCRDAAAEVLAAGVQNGFGAGDGGDSGASGFGGVNGGSSASGSGVNGGALAAQCVFDVFMKLWNGRDDIDPAALAPGLGDLLESRARDQARSKAVDRIDGLAAQGAAANGLFAGGAPLFGGAPLIDGSAIILDGEESHDSGGIDGEDPDRAAAAGKNGDTKKSESDDGGREDPGGGKGRGIKNKKKLIVIASIAIVILLAAGAVATVLSVKKHSSGDLPPGQSTDGPAVIDPEKEYEAVMNDVEAWLGESYSIYSVEDVDVKLPEILENRLVHSTLGTVIAIDSTLDSTGTLTGVGSGYTGSVTNSIDDRILDLVSTMISYYDAATYSVFGKEIRLGADGAYYYESEVWIVDNGSNYPSFSPLSAGQIRFRVKVGHLGTYEWGDYGGSGRYGTGRLLSLTEAMTVLIPFVSEEDFYTLNPHYSTSSISYAVDSETGELHSYSTQLTDVGRINREIEKRFATPADYTKTPSYDVALPSSIRSAQLARTGYNRLRIESVTDFLGNTNKYYYRLEPWVPDSPDVDSGLNHIELRTDLENQHGSGGAASQLYAIVLVENGKISAIGYSEKLTSVEKGYSDQIELTTGLTRPRDTSVIAGPIDTLFISAIKYSFEKTTYGIDSSWNVLSEEYFNGEIVEYRETVIPGISRNDPQLSEYTKYTHEGGIHFQIEGYVYGSDKANPITRRIWSYNEGSSYGACCVYNVKGYSIAIAEDVLSEDGQWDYLYYDGGFPVYHDVDWLRENYGRDAASTGQSVLSTVGYDYLNMNVLREPDIMVVNMDGYRGTTYKLYTKERITLRLPGEVTGASSSLPMISFTVQVCYTGRLDRDNGVATMTYENSDYVGLSGITYDALFEIYRTKLDKVEYTDENYFIDAMSVSDFRKELDKYLSKMINNAEQQDEPFEWLKVDLSAEGLRLMPLDPEF
jgi:hypothetical protein